MIPDALDRPPRSLEQVAAELREHAAALAPDNSARLERMRIIMRLRRIEAEIAERNRK
jgi:hypothetical protein